MKKKKTKETWAQDSYETGYTSPPKNRGGLAAMLLVLVILFCGAVSYLGILNIRLGRQLRKSNVPVEFYPSVQELADSDHPEGFLLPGVEGRAFSVPEQSFYKGPAGIVVTKVLPESAAAAAGLVVGDVITAVNGQPVANPADVSKILGNLQPETAVVVTFFDNDGNYHTFQFAPTSGK